MADTPRTMTAMVLEATTRPLVPRRLPVPELAAGEVLIEVEACGVCRTDLHLVDGELEPAPLPRIPGHQAVGRIRALGDGVAGRTVGERVGVPWLGGSCERCRYCLRGDENLCQHAVFTGYTRDGGFAELMTADSRFAFPLPGDGDAVAAAPLLCAGLIGFRAYRKAGPGERLGLYGFGAAAHLLIQLAVADGRRVYAFTRPGDETTQSFARSLGACWAGGSDEPPPEPLDAAILFAPVGALVPAALRAVDKGGRVVCAGIHMSDIPGFPYRDLWEERQILSVANLTRQDGLDFFQRIARTPLENHTRRYALRDANRALDDLRHGRFEGSAVLTMDG